MSTIWNDADIPLLIAATGGVPCTIDGVDGIALMDWNDALFSGDPARGEVIVGQPMLTIQTSAFPNARVDSFVVIDAKWYTVRERLKYGDGGTTKLFLGPASGTPPPAPPTIIDGGEFDGSDGTGHSPDGGGFVVRLTLTPHFADDFSVDANPLDPASWYVPSVSGGLNITPLQAVGGECKATALDNDDPNNLSIEGVNQPVPNDCYCSAVANIVPDSGAAFDLYIRANLDLSNLYLLEVSDDFASGLLLVTLGKETNNVPTTFASLTTPFVSGTVWSLVAIGNQIYALKDGATVMQTTDSAFTSGGAGVDIIVYASVDECTLDNFEMGSASR